MRRTSDGCACGCGDEDRGGWRERSVALPREEKPFRAAARASSEAVFVGPLLLPYMLPPCMLLPCMLLPGVLSGRAAWLKSRG